MGEWPGFPPPEIRARHAYREEIPKGARDFYDLAIRLGWKAWMSYARGTWMNADGSPARRTASVPVFKDDGTPELTPTGRPRTARVDAGPRVVDNILVRCIKGDLMIAACWIDGKPEFVRENLGTWLGFDEAKRWIKKGRPSDETPG